MRIIKSIISVVIVLMMLLSLNFTSAEEYIPNYKEEAELLLGMRLIDIEDEDLFNKCTRGEFARIITQILNRNQPYFGDTDVFSDINIESEYFGPVSFMYNKGFMTGHTDGTFRPEGNISYDEAVAVMVKVLGYGAKATAKGGYPNGFKIVANEIRLSEGFSADNYSSLTCDEICKLIYNSLFVAMAEQISFGESVEYNSDKGNTLLNTYLDMDYSEGILSDNSLSSLTGQTNIKSGAILVDGVVVEDVSYEAKAMLGYYVKVFYKIKDYKNEFVYISKSEDKNNVLVITADKINKSSSLTEISYEVSDDVIRKARVKKDAYYFKNGEATSTLLSSDLKLSGGNITLVDYNGDKTYDSLFINEFQTIVFQGLNAERKIIFGKYGTNDKIEFKDIDNIEVINKDGESITLDKLKEFDVLAVWKSKNSIKIEVCTEVVVGMLDEVNTEYHIIGGKEHTVAPEYKNSALKMPLVGDEGTFYFGKGGFLAYYEPMQTKNVGIAVAMNKKISSLSDTIPQIIIYTTDGKFVTFDFEERIRFCGSSLKSTDIYNKSGLFDNNGEFIRQVVLYELGEKGEITSFDIEDTTKSNNDTLQSASPSRSYRYCNPGTDVITPTGDIANQDNRAMFITANAYYFKLPTDVMAERFYSVTKGSLPYQHNDVIDNTQVYFTTDATKKTAVADVIVSTVATSRNGSWFNRGTVVAGIVQGINPDGEPCEILKGYTDGKLVSYYATDGAKINGLEIGDMIQLTQNEGDIVRYRKTYSIRHDKTSIEWYLEHKDDGTLSEFYSISDPDSVDSLDYYINKALLSDQTTYSSRSDNTLNNDKGGVYITGTVTYKSGNSIIVEDSNGVEYNFLLNENEFEYYKTSACRVKKDVQKVESVRASSVNIDDKVCVITEAYSVMNILIIE